MEKFDVSVAIYERPQNNMPPNLVVNPLRSMKIHTKFHGKPHSSYPETLLWKPWVAKDDSIKAVNMLSCLPYLFIYFCKI